MHMQIVRIRLHSVHVQIHGSHSCGILVCMCCSSLFLHTLGLMELYVYGYGWFRKGAS